ncbi:MAG: agmatinase [Paracoccaceae bacterium]|nr:agmatinase [Paracoccaceae bacterium]
MTDPYRKDYAFLAEDNRAVTHDEEMFSGALSFCRRRYARDLAGADLAVIGVPCDTATTGRPGCRLGPRGIRAASANLAWSHCWPSPFDPFERLAVVDWGDISFDLGNPAGVPAQIEAAVTHVLNQGAAALCLGGDHFLTYPILKAHAAKHGRGISLIQFDAHCDTAEDGAGQINHGTMFYHAAQDGTLDAKRSIQVGIRTTYTDTSDFVIHDANSVHEQGIDAAVARIREVVGDNCCYITFDIDCLDPAYAPGTGTPVCGGLSTWQAKEIIRRLDGIDLIGMDVVEVSPPFDHAEITSLAGATIALELICLMARLRG